MSNLIEGCFCRGKKKLKRKKKLSVKKKRIRLYKELEVCKESGKAKQPQTKAETAKSKERNCNAAKGRNNGCSKSRDPERTAKETEEQIKVIAIILKKQRDVTVAANCKTGKQKQKLR